MPNPALQEALERKDNEASKLMAYEMYMRFETVEKISRDIKVSVNTIKHWIYGRDGVGGGWDNERTQVSKEIVQETITSYKHKKQAYLPSILEVSLALVLNAVQNRAKDMADNPVGIMEAKTISDMICNLEKLQALNGEAESDIHAVKANITIEDLKKAVQNDYFLEILPNGQTKPIKEGQIDDTHTDARVSDPFTLE